MQLPGMRICLPGYPGAPSAIKISKSVDGAHLSWEPPIATAGRIIEYSVCLAVRQNTSPVTVYSSTFSLHSLVFMEMLKTRLCVFQGDSQLAYLVNIHKLHRLNWFKRMKILLIYYFSCFIRHGCTQGANFKVNMKVRDECF